MNGTSLFRVLFLGMLAAGGWWWWTDHQAHEEERQAEVEEHNREMRSEAGKRVEATREAVEKSAAQYDDRVLKQAQDE